MSGNKPLSKYNLEELREYVGAPPENTSSKQELYELAKQMRDSAAERTKQEEAEQARDFREHEPRSEGAVQRVAPDEADGNVSPIVEDNPTNAGNPDVGATATEGTPRPAVEPPLLDVPTDEDGKPFVPANASGLLDPAQVDKANDSKGGEQTHVASTEFTAQFSNSGASTPDPNAPAPSPEALQELKANALPNESDPTPNFDGMSSDEIRAYLAERDVPTPSDLNDDELPEYARQAFHENFAVGMGALNGGSGDPASTSGNTVRNSGDEQDLKHEKATGRAYYTVTAEDEGLTLVDIAVKFGFPQPGEVVKLNGGDVNDLRVHKGQKVYFPAPLIPTIEERGAAEATAATREGLGEKVREGKLQMAGMPVAGSAEAKAISDYHKERSA